MNGKEKSLNEIPFRLFFQDPPLPPGKGSLRAPPRQSKPWKMRVGVLLVFLIFLGSVRLLSLHPAALSRALIAFLVDDLHPCVEPGLNVVGDTERPGRWLVDQRLDARGEILGIAGSGVTCSCGRNTLEPLAVVDNTLSPQASASSTALEQAS